MGIREIERKVAKRYTPTHPKEFLKCFFKPQLSRRARRFGFWKVKFKKKKNHLFNNFRFIFKFLNDVGFNFKRDMSMHDKCKSKTNGKCKHYQNERRKIDFLQTITDFPAKFNSRKKLN